MDNLLRFYKGGLQERTTLMFFYYKGYMNGQLLTTFNLANWFADLWLRDKQMCNNKNFGQIT